MLTTENNIKEQKIIYSARKIFYEKGFKKATTRLIAENANVNHAMIHYYFRDKKKLAVVVLDDFYKKMNFLVIPYFMEKTDPMLFEAVMLRVIYHHILSDTGFLNFYKEIVDADIVEDYFMEYGTKLFIKSALYHNKSLDEEKARLIQLTITALEQKLLQKLSKNNPIASFDHFIDFLISIPFKLMYFDKKSIEKTLVQSQKLFKKIEPLSVPIINHFEEPSISKLF
jgi:AcrR family transcriptional regulator